MDVFGDIWDEVGQDELEGQQSVLETHNNNNQRITGAADAQGLFFQAPLLYIADGGERMLILLHRRTPTEDDMSKNIRLRQPGIVRKDVFEAERGQYLHYEMMFTFSAWTSDAFLIFALFFANALWLYYCYT